MKRMFPLLISLLLIVTPIALSSAKSPKNNLSKLAIVTGLDQFAALPTKMIIPSFKFAMPTIPNNEWEKITSAYDSAKIYRNILDQMEQQFSQQEIDFLVKAFKPIEYLKFSAAYNETEFLRYSISLRYLELLETYSKDKRLSTADFAFVDEYLQKTESQQSPIASFLNSFLDTIKNEFELKEVAYQNPRSTKSRTPKAKKDTLTKKLNNINRNYNDSLKIITKKLKSEIDSLINTLRDIGERNRKLAEEYRLKSERYLYEGKQQLENLQKEIDKDFRELQKKYDKEFNEIRKEIEKLLEETKKMIKEFQEDYERELFPNQNDKKDDSQKKKRKKVN